MSTDVSGEQMQAKITAARREAEGLKDRIKRKKDELADTSRKYFGVFELRQLIHGSQTSRATAHRSLTKNRNETPKDAQRTSRQNLRHALVERSKTSGLSFSRWKVDHLGCLHNQQSSRHSSTIILGHDLRIRTQW